MSQRIHIALFLISAALIAYQIILMQILSIVQWHHFAFMIISLALLGFGASGTMLSLFKDWLIKREDIVIPTSMLMAGFIIVFSLPLSQLDIFRFDTYLLFTDNQHIFKLVLAYLLFFTPFFFGAMVIGLIFVCYSKNISKLYFSNLMGSGLGGIAALIILSVFTSNQVTIVVSLFPLLGGIILINKSNKFSTITLALIYSSVLIYNTANPSQLLSSQYKALSKTLNLPDAEIEIEKTSPYGLIQVVKSDYIRFAPGLSLTYTGNVPVRKAVFNNGNWVGPILSHSSIDSNFVLDFTTDALVYKLTKNDNVLILSAGAGEDVIHALSHNTKQIIAVESNTALNSLMFNQLAEDTDSLYYADNVELIEMSPRTFLQVNYDSYDVIKLPKVGAFGGTSGTQAIQEEFLFTTDAIGLILDRLKSEGFFTITSWMDYPYRNPLKALTTIVEGLILHGIKEPTLHIAAIRSWGTITFLVKKNRLTDNDIKTIRSFCGTMNFDPAIFPGITNSERTRYNQLQDDSFFTYIDTLLSSGRKDFIMNYPFRISAPNDNKPYFSQFINWKNLPNVKKYFGTRSIPFFELGYLIVILTLIQVVIVSFLLIIMPLFKLGWKGSNKLWTILYFTGLGVGYMFIEIVLIQKFALYFGNPIISVSAVISFMLICSGVGSYFSSYYESSTRNLLSILLTIILLLLIYSIILDSLLINTSYFPLTIKLFISFFIIGVPAFVMGFPFPLGIKRLDRANQNQIPWAWGINSCFSVVSTVLATVISVELGFIAIFIFAAVAYGLSFIANFTKMTV